MLVWKQTNQRPVQSRQGSAIEMTVDDSAGVGKMTTAMCRGLVKLTPAANGTIAVVVRMVQEFPLIRHFGNLPRSSQLVTIEYEQLPALGR